MGADVGGAYNSDSQAYDALVRDAQPTGSAIPVAGNQEMVIIFAAGNAGPGVNTAGSPGTGKNVFTIGASENVHPFGGSDGCVVADSGADSLNDIIGFSSRGPLDDSRVKPDLVAPGTHVTGGVFQQNPIDTGNGAADPGFNGSGVCGGVGSNFFPAGQQFFTASSGTSHSTPAVAGGAALLRQYFINQGLTPPSPAMTKAYLMNASRYMTGTSANDNLYSNNQGMGLMNLGVAFDGVARRLLDQGLTFSDTGQIYVANGNVISTGQPFRVTLAWTDTPGPTTGNAFVNDLDLEVIVGGNTYRGNVFSGANSVTGGSADPRNNVESVLLPAGVSGPYTVRVIAKNIAGNGVPNNPDPTDQDFALVTYNGNTVLQPALALAGINASDIVSGNNNNGAIDPGETIRLNVSLTNAGDLIATGVSGQTTVTGGSATMLNPTSAYPDIAVGATVTNTIPYTFAVSAAHVCGQPITFAFSSTYNLTRTLTANFALPTGVRPTNSFTNSTNITIPNSGVATPYPANIAVSSITGLVGKVTVTLTNLSHTFPDDVDILLVGPGGQRVILMSDAGGSLDITNITLTFDDAAAASLPDNTIITSGAYKPTNFGTGDTFPTPAPAGPYGSALSAFNGTNPNGTWQLYVTDAFSPDSGSIAGGWSLTITESASVCAVPPANLAINKTVTPATATPGQPLTYTLAFSNAGNGSATGVVITDIILAEILSATVTSNGAAITPTGGSSFIWQVADLGPGQGGVITLTGIISPTINQGSIITNTAIISGTGPGGEVDSGNNTSTVNVPVAALAPPDTLIYLPILLKN
ncbi:MAG: S8 family serine peptidase [Anaerolineales bacterium]|nr:S8 family serine peptidase [Anaerolineales bacterium]